MSGRRNACAARPGSLCLPCSAAQLPPPVSRKPAVAARSRPIEITCSRIALRIALWKQGPTGAMREGAMKFGEEGQTSWRANCLEGHMTLCIASVGGHMSFPHMGLGTQLALPRRSDCALPSSNYGLEELLDSSASRRELGSRCARAEPQCQQVVV